MRLAVIRDDLPGPILLTDLEQVSGRNVPVDAPGQVRYISLPTAEAVETALADSTTGVGATLRGSALTFNVTINSGNKVLRLKTAAADAFVNYTIAEAAYTTIATLLAAVNNAIEASGVVAFNIGNALVLEAPTKGVDSYLQTDTIANGGTANTILGFANGAIRTMPAASAYLTAAGIPDGPLDVSQAALEAVGATTNSNALEPYYDAEDPRATVVADAIAPIFAETDVALDSFLVGTIAGYHSANFNPDSRNPAVDAGAAIDVVENDGSTAFETAHTLPNITTADLNTPTSGDLTITGVGMGRENGGGTLGYGVVVKLTGAVSIRLEQKEIIEGGGSVSETTIFIPAALVPGATTVTTSAQVMVRQRVSDIVALS